MLYFVYILQSLKDNSFYTGVTNNYQKRLSQHNRGEVKSTKNKRPWKSVYLEQFDNRKDAYRREKYIKSRKKRKFIENLIRKKKSLK